MTNINYKSQLQNEPQNRNIFANQFLTWKESFVFGGVALFILSWLVFGIAFILTLLIGDPQFSKIEADKYMMATHPGFGFHEVSKLTYTAMNTFITFAKVLHSLGFIGLGVAVIIRIRNKGRTKLYKFRPPTSTD